MDDSLEFAEHGYQIEKELGHNRAGGRLTYLATHIQTGQQVVIKQFQFARSGASWGDYTAYEREIQVLQGLEHSGIPRYLDSFQMAQGFCMVQEYKQAQSLGIPRSFHFNDVQRIAKAALEILVYLQHRVPPVIHRDIKPENILVDQQLNVYLVDFGFAHIGDGEVGISSVVKGTLGFMPPEQLFNRQLTEASDLYGLGITLICLLTGTKSIDVGNLIDISYRVNFRHLVPKLSMSWVNWLDKMVEPKQKERFPNAATALAAMPAHPMRPPDVQLNQTRLHFTATKPGEKLTQTVTIHNAAPETQLAGEWAVAAHVSDPPHTPDAHIWIAVQPPQFEANQLTCEVTVDTSKLMSGKVYTRNLHLQTNAFPSTHTIDLVVRTAPPPTPVSRLPYGVLGLLFTLSLLVTWVAAQIAVPFASTIAATTSPSLGFVAGATIGFEFTAWMLTTAGASAGAAVSAVAGILAGVIALGIVLTTTIAVPGLLMLIVAGAGFLGGAIAGAGAGVTVEHLVRRGKPQRVAIGVVLLVMALAGCLGVGGAVGDNPWLLGSTMGTGLLLAGTLLYLLLQQVQVNQTRRHSERHLIKP